MIADCGASLLSYTRSRPYMSHGLQARNERRAQKRLIQAEAVPFVGRVPRVRPLFWLEMSEAIDPAHAFDFIKPGIGALVENWGFFINSDAAGICIAQEHTGKSAPTLHDVENAFVKVWLASRHLIGDVHSANVDWLLEAGFAPSAIDQAPWGPLIVRTRESGDRDAMSNAFLPGGTWWVVEC